MCVNQVVLSFLHLFEAEYTDLSREWVLALLGISKNHFSKNGFGGHLSHDSYHALNAWFFNKEETWILVLNLIFISALWF